MMKKIQNYLLIGIFIMTALLAAVAGLEAYSGYMEKKAEEEALFQQRKEEILARNAEAQNRVQEMEVEIIQLQEDVEALQAFIDETVNAANEVQNRKETGSNDVSGQPGSVSENDTSDYPASVSGNDGSEDSVSGNRFDGSSVSGNDGSDDSVSGNRFDGSSVSGNTVSGNTVSGNTVSGNTVSGNSVSGNGDFGFLMGSVSKNDDVNYYDGNTSDDIFDEWRSIYEQSDMTLEERKALRTSYEETLEVNQADREWIAENQYDFSQMKIACLGDSITKAANLEGEENYEQYAYPARLQELLGAQQVYNLGIGGSSIGRYWADAFVDRYMEIPADSDIIIVMGGTNDGFCVSDEEFGSLEEREYHTFCGDLDELMRGLRENYPDAKIFFATPLPNVLQDYLMSEREYLLPQKKFVEVIQVLADEYDFELIDLYNSNVLDSHDVNIITEYMPDGVHGNPAGYQILAEHFAGEIVKYYNEDTLETAEEDTGEESISTENGGLGTGTGANSGANAGAGAAAVIGGTTGAGTGNGMGNETGNENDAETDVGNGTEAGSEAEADGDSGTGTDGDSGTESGSGTGTDGDSGTESGSGTGTDGDSGTESGSGTGTDGDSGTESGSGTEADGDSGTESGSGTEADGDTGTESRSGIGEEADSSSERKQNRYDY